MQGTRADQALTELRRPAVSSPAIAGAGRAKTLSRPAKKQLSMRQRRAARCDPRLERWWGFARRGQVRGGEARRRLSRWLWSGWL